MEKSIQLQRRRTNVDFVDEQGQSFAGVYVLQQSSLTVAEALGMLKASFHFTFSWPSQGNNDKEPGWGIYPYRGQLSSEAFSLDKPLAKGRYYVVRHIGSWEGMGVWKEHTLGESFRYVIVQTEATEGGDNEAA